jgi:hypothetical protein
MLKATPLGVRCCAPDYVAAYCPRSTRPQRPRTTVANTEAVVAEICSLISPLLQLLIRYGSGILPAYSWAAGAGVIWPPGAISMRVEYNARRTGASCASADPSAVLTGYWPA